MTSRNTSAQPEPQFKVHDHVVYPLQGVGEVVRIEEREFKGEGLLYYVIYIPVSDMTVMVPVHKAAEIGIRPIVSREEALEALDFISENPQAGPTDWKTRYQMNLDLLKKGSVMDIARVVRALYYRSKIKELPILERKLFDNALRILVDEISFALEISAKEVEARIFQQLEQESAPIEEEEEDLFEEEDEDLNFEEEDEEENGDDMEDADLDEEDDSEE
ncbi:transcriptional regulator, CarD family [Spirochaeta thermophila DSM 6578]|uniref:Transcriptional regulator, CarD family n=1 Tax=Winmispira thermophila (strain ATCC 700085 / DSM 6578 / Z-1203) TaxID=869211 RepID=G0GDS1_WINT7|nr:CarD family transcriptional regulator [Spirochaeta thermophila]AEJ62201.1 transcriptional regulator, CarD family [Spirochaeta thermophila DSM 6578]